MEQNPENISKLSQRMTPDGTRRQSARHEKTWKNTGKSGFSLNHLDMGEFAPLHMGG